VSIVNVDDIAREALRTPATRGGDAPLLRAYEDLEQERYLRDWRERRGVRRRTFERLAALVRR
jgi:hypothetical protein